jgi:hypothetical protein
MAQYKTKSLMDMKMGLQVKERIDYEMARVIENINDPNTDPKKKRQIKVTIELTPLNERESVNIDFAVVPVLCPTGKISGQLAIVSAGQNAGVYEVTANIPGQIDINGDEQEAPAMLKMLTI